jgi:hypothetical protein
MKTTNQEPLMTEAEFIAKFKAAGFELYKTENIKPKLDYYYANVTDTECSICSMPDDNHDVNCSHATNG